jgi:hypothetical protein
MRTRTSLSLSLLAIVAACGSSGPSAPVEAVSSAAPLEHQNNACLWGSDTDDTPTHLVTVARSRFNVLPELF